MPQRSRIDEAAQHAVADPGVVSKLTDRALAVGEFGQRLAAA